MTIAPSPEESAHSSVDDSVTPDWSDPTGDGANIAFEFLRGLATELSNGTVDLPCFPDVAIRIRNALADPRATIAQTANLVGAEPRLAAQLLRTVNSAAFNVSGKKVTNLRIAITRLGQQMVQATAMSFAVQVMRNEASLRSIAKPLSELWRDCISVASICQIVASYTKVSPDEAFLTGLLHGIGRLYIMVRAANQSHAPADYLTRVDLLADWQASIGKAVLENWGFSDSMCDAVRDQADSDHESEFASDLTDVLVAGIAIAAVVPQPEPRVIDFGRIQAFRRIGLTMRNCADIIQKSEYQLGALHDALGC